MKLHILGCHAATPRALGNPTSQVLDIKSHLFLIDCGEGTQVALRKHKIKFSRISHIFISHLHGDHFFGLPGIVTTFQLLGREKELHIYGPKGIKEAITLLLKVGNSWTKYPLIFHELTGKEPVVLYENNKVKVTTIPLDHRIYTNGFLFQERPQERSLNVAAVSKYNIDKAYYRIIKQGKDHTLENGRLVPNAELTFDPPPPKSYAYCSDTAYDPSIVPLVQQTDLLYHEATFLETESALALKTKHSTAKEAANIAKKAEVGQLLLGHFSTRYKDTTLFKKEAQSVFPNVLLAEDGKEIDF